jgi:hypothetical protein
MDIRVLEATLTERLKHIQEQINLILEHIEKRDSQIADELFRIKKDVEQLERDLNAFKLEIEKRISRLLFTVITVILTTVLTFISNLLLRKIS